MKTIKSILVFRNGNIAAFDEHDNQIELIQAFTMSDLVRQFAEDIGCSVDGCKVSMCEGNFTIPPKDQSK